MARMHDELEWPCFPLLLFRRALMKRRFASAHCALSLRHATVLLSPPTRRHAPATLARRTALAR
eukprot:1673574-Pleurochrysis_carterae.AAC.1